MKNTNELSVLLAGDMGMRSPLDTLIGTEKEKEIFSEVKPIIENSDVSIVNLENPLTDNPNAIIKSGCILSGPEKGISLIQSAGFDAAILANNHIGDCGEEGVIKTIELLKQNEIGFIGADRNEDEAKKPWVAEKCAKKLAVIAVTENEFGIAEKNMAGAYGFDIRSMQISIEKANNECDYLLVIYHGGNEHNPIPSPVIVDRFRMFIDFGADAVVGMHPHIVQGYEFYKNKPIVYSTGNFLFCNDNWPDPECFWYFGYMPKLTFTEIGTKLEIYPYRFNKDGSKISLLEGVQKNKFLTHIEKVSEPVKEPSLLKDYYDSWCVLKGREFANWLHYTNVEDPEQAKINRPLLNLRNGLTCEAHNDLLKTYLKIKCNGKENECAEKIRDIIKLQKINID